MTTDSQTCLTMLRISIHPSFHSSLYHFCVNCHLSIIMVSGCWSPSQQSQGEKQDCDKNSFEMEFHLYCLFSHCQTVRVVNLCTFTNEATLRGDPNRWMGVFPSFLGLFWHFLYFQWRPSLGSHVFWRHFWCAVSPFLLQRKRPDQNTWLPEPRFHLKHKREWDKPRKVGALPELCHPHISGVSKKKNLRRVFKKNNIPVHFKPGNAETTSL